MRSNMFITLKLLWPNAVRAPEETETSISFWYVPEASPFPLSSASFIAPNDAESGLNLAMRARASLALRLGPQSTPAFWHREQSSPGTRSHCSITISTLDDSELGYPYRFFLNPTPETSQSASACVGQTGR